MTKYSKFNVIYRLQKWLDSVPGQTFMNYAYSWGASIVILGTLFKLTHLPGANFMLFLGMGTEVVVFFIAAFDRPFDKTADGMDLPTHLEEETQSDIVTNGEEGFVSTAGGNAAGPVIIGSGGVAGGETSVGGEGAVTGGVGGGTIIGGGGIVGGGGTVVIGGGGSTEDLPEGYEAAAGNAGAPGSGIIGGGAVISGSLELPDINEDMEDATNNYVEQLKKLTETLQKVSEQSERLTRDSEEMENLNRTLTGICKVYEMQLKGASQQIGTIDEINDQTRKMAEQIAELNKIYARMIEAMTVNMPKLNNNGD